MWNSQDGKSWETTVLYISWNVRGSSRNWIFIELNLNFYWIELEFRWISLNWNWIEIELKLNFIELKLNYGIKYCYNRLAIRGPISPFVWTKKNIFAGTKISLFFSCELYERIFPATISWEYSPRVCQLLRKDLIEQTEVSEGWIVYSF